MRNVELRPDITNIICHVVGENLANSRHSNPKKLSINIIQNFTSGQRYHSHKRIALSILEPQLR